MNLLPVRSASRFRKAACSVLPSLCVLAACWMQSAVAAAKPPNVVLIISDDQAWTDFGFMGSKAIRTPHLDRFAKQSAVFPWGYVPSSLCRPSLMTMVTGLYPHQHKIVGNDPPRGTDRRLMLKHIRRLPTLPKLLTAKGYLSHQSGKWWEGNYREGGFTAGMTHGDPKRGGRHGDLGLKIGRQGMQPVFDFIDSAGEKPFFLWYAPFLPHQPHRPPKRLLDKYRKPGRPLALARYYAMCEWFDETCGQLLGYLDKKKLSENTLVVFIVDNGWIQRTPATKVPKGWRFGFAPKSKRSPYDGGIRTPILLRWPGKIKAGRYDALAESIDLAPTILAAAGLKPTKQMPGINLMDVVKAGGKSQRKAIYGEVFAHDEVDIDRPAASLQYRWCVEGKWKLIVPADRSATSELYDLRADPHETRNVVGAHPEIASRLAKQIDRWWAGKRAGK
jgi:arylsulfatase A-like enzyme